MYIDPKCELASHCWRMSLDGRDGDKEPKSDNNRLRFTTSD
jgi:hypothetical protein